jgi:hypothetical protein
VARSTLAEFDPSQGNQRGVFAGLAAIADGAGMATAPNIAPMSVIVKTRETNISCWRPRELPRWRCIAAIGFTTARDPFCANAQFIGFNGY